MQKIADLGTLVIVLFFGAFIGYITCVFVVDLKIDTLRPHINAKAIEQGVNAGISRYKEEYLAGEHLKFHKRRERDEAIRKYIKQLDRMMDYKPE